MNKKVNGILKIAVIGGGASGMAAAIVASQYKPETERSITIFEHNSELGKKILSCGNGKCNLGNLGIEPKKYHTTKNTGIKEDIRGYGKQCDNGQNDSNNSDNLIRSVLDRFDASDTIKFFEDMGLWIVNNNGYLYPKSEQASTVRDILTGEVKRLGIRTQLDSDISVINANADGTFTVINHNEEMVFDRVIMACGSYAGILKKDRIPSDRDGYSLSYHLGHKIEKVKPALCAIECGDDNMHNMLKGVRVKAGVSLLEGDELIDRSEGEILFTDYGVSGIAVFDISHAVNADKCQSIVIKLSGYNSDTENAWAEQIKKYYGRTVMDMFMGMMNSHLAEYIITEIYDLKQETVIDDEVQARLLSKDYDIIVISGPFKTRKYENAQVCRGGISLGEITEDMESRITPGLFFTGEMLDVDAICGGYNLHWAWATGNIAGRAVYK